MDTCSRVLTISSGENIVAVKPAASEPAAISLAIGHGSPLYCAAAVIRVRGVNAMYSVNLHRLFTCRKVIHAGSSEVNQTDHVISIWAAYRHS